MTLEPIMVPRKTQLAHRARELVGRALRSLHRQCRDPHEARGMRRHMFGELVVLDGGVGRAERGVLIVEVRLAVAGVGPRDRAWGFLASPPTYP